MSDPIVQADGSTLYSGRLDITDVTLNGKSQMAFEPVEIMVQPDGWGYVLTNINPATGKKKVWVSGLTRNYTRWGWIAVTRP